MNYAGPLIEKGDIEKSSISLKSSRIDFFYDAQ